MIDQHRGFCLLRIENVPVSSWYSNILFFMKTINLIVPRGWHELDDKQLRYLFGLLADDYPILWPKQSVFIYTRVICKIDTNNIHQ